MCRRPSTHPAQQGFGLAELLVSLVIGLALSLIVSTMVAKQEGIRRGVTSTNDIGANSAYASYTLDRELRNAGSGFSQAYGENYGCPLNVSKGNTQILPRPSAFPAPFDKVDKTIRLAPVVVYAGAGNNGSDVIVAMAGSSGLGENSRRVVEGSLKVDQLQLTNTVGLSGGDIVVVSQQGVRCLVQQVKAGFVGSNSPTLDFAGDYQASTVNGVSLSSFAGNNAFVSVLGNATGRQPRFQLLGLNASNQLTSLDLLQLNQVSAQPLVEGVVDLRVLYGLDTTGNHTQVNQWVAPTAAGFTAAALTAGGSAAQANLQSIIALRVGIVLRGDLVEREQVSPKSLSLFSDLDDALHYTYEIPEESNRQRYRAVEFTVPLRNVRNSR